MDHSSVLGPVGPSMVLVWRLALALGAGVFVGLERERRGKPGVRTFAFVCMTACIASVLGDGYAWVTLGLVGILVVILNARQLIQNQSIELTTSAALFLVAFIGILAGAGYTFAPVALAVVTAAFLAWKQPLHSFAGGLSEGEIRSAIMLALLTLVVFPLLPDAPVDRWELVNPRSAWFAVIVLAMLGWANYLLWRIYGSRGMAVASLLGGLVNSTAAAAELAQRARTLGDRFLRLAGRGIVLATVAMLARNLVIAGVLAPAVAAPLAVPIGAMLAASAICIWKMDTRWLPAPEDGAPGAETMSLGSPFSLAAVLRFGAVFILLQVAGTLAQRTLGEFGFYVVCVAGGLFSSSSAVAAAGTLASEGTLPVAVAVTGALLATMTSAVVSLPLVARFGRQPRLTRAVRLSVIVIVIGGALGWAAMRLPFENLWRLFP